MATTRANFFVKVGMSLWLVFHLFVIAFVPNAQNYLGMKLAPVIGPYANFFELTNAWSFFAPEPGPPPVFIEYELLSRAGDSLRNGLWPDLNEKLIFRDRLNRRIAVAEYMISSEQRAEKMMAPYLCSRNPDAGSVRLWRVAYGLPGFNEVAKGGKPLRDESRIERHLVSHNFCEDKVK